MAYPLKLIVHPPSAQKPYISQDHFSGGKTGHISNAKLYLREFEQII